MNYSSIIFSDVANGYGVRTTLFVSGCRNHCEGCFNPESWDFNFGKEFNESVEQEIYNHMDDYHDGISILGGDPLEPENAKALLPFLRQFKEKYPDKTVWLYTGYSYEGMIILEDDRKRVLEYVDVLIDGKFILSQRDITLKFRGSRNQRIIDVKKSTKDNIVLWDN